MLKYLRALVHMLMFLRCNMQLILENCRSELIYTKNLRFMFKMLIERISQSSEERNIKSFYISIKEGHRSSTELYSVLRDKEHLALIMMLRPQL